MTVITSFEKDSWLVSVKIRSYWGAIVVGGGDREYEGVERVEEEWKGDIGTMLRAFESCLAVEISISCVKLLIFWVYYFISSQTKSKKVWCDF